MLVKEHGLCFNCLSRDHTLSKSNFLCRVEGCDKLHHKRWPCPKYMQNNKDSKNTKANEWIDEGKNQNTKLHNQYYFRR